MDKEEVIRFFRIQLNRCKINLRGAKERHDDRAVDNIKHKMEIYEYTIKKLSSEVI